MPSSDFSRQCDTLIFVSQWAKLTVESKPMRAHYAKDIHPTDRRRKIPDLGV